MRRAVVRGGLAAAIVMGSTMWAWPASAGGGGGCHGRVTDGEGDTVAMSKACFSPSVLRVDPGTEVTFINKDPVPHNVSAPEWGYFDELMESDSFRATFQEPGIYPFACTYHPGMTGAIVVGNGLGAGSGEVVTEEPLAGAAATSSEETAPTAVSADGSSGLGWALGGAGGFVLGGASALLVRRRRAAAG